MRTSRFVGIVSIAAWGLAASCSNDVGPREDETDVRSARLVVDTSGPIGTWYLNANNGYRLKLTIAPSGGGYTGTLDGASLPAADISWNPSTRLLEFRRPGPGWHQWYRLVVTEGVTLGRFSHSASSAKPTQLTAYAFQVSGWNQQYLDHGETTPRSYEAIVNGDYRVKLRIDRNSSGGLVGRFKVHSRVSNGALGEGLEEDVTVNSWNGQTLVFTRPGSGWTQVYTGQVVDNKITGTFTHNGSGAYPWSGMRAGVLGYGISEKSSQASAEWRCRIRRALARLTMGGRPTPTLVSATLEDAAPPIPCSIPTCPFVAPPPPSPPPPARDDNPQNHPQAYTGRRYTFQYSIPNPYGGSAVSRPVTGWLVTPNGTPPAGGFPAAIVVNGHGGSAFEHFIPQHPGYWYGDSFARRGFVVLAIDISHRPPDQITPPYDKPRQGLYTGSDDGDGPTVGNGPHPPVRMPGFTTSDWTDDGERAWDVIQGFEWLQQQSNVNPWRISIMGLSMGGEVATFAAAMEPRIAMAVSAGYSPDYDVLMHLNHGCWQWAHTYRCLGCGEGSVSGIREYIDHSDLLAMTADRWHIVQTGTGDALFSLRTPPFSGDKQVLRRARASGSNFYHFLHPAGHFPRMGPITVPLQIEPQPPGTQSWQTDSGVVGLPDTVLDLTGTVYNFYYDTCSQ